MLGALLFCNQYTLRVAVLTLSAVRMCSITKLTVLRPLFVLLTLFSSTLDEPLQHACLVWSQDTFAAVC